MMVVKKGNRKTEKVTKTAKPKTGSLKIVRKNSRGTKGIKLYKNTINRKKISHDAV